MQITGYPLRPESQGTVTIGSADPLEAPKIRPNYLSVELDQRISIAALRYIRRLYATPPLAGLVGAETLPGPGVERDDEILDAIRRTGQAVMHCAGTCRMGGDAASVVDERLRVRGVVGLRVVDCSVMPTLVSGNTNAAVMAIAWRAASMILADRHG
jgi:choline dehydrogenase